jgi:hypothetical protein
LHDSSPPAEPFAPARHYGQPIIATSCGCYHLTPTHATNTCLNVNGASSTDGANVQIWMYGGANNQLWTFQTP